MKNNIGLKGSILLPYCLAMVPDGDEICDPSLEPYPPPKWFRGLKKSLQDCPPTCPNASNGGSQLVAEPLILQAMFAAQPKIFEAQHPIWPLGRVGSLQSGQTIWKLCFKFGMHFSNACIQYLQPASNVGGHFGCMIRRPRV